MSERTPGDFLEQEQRKRNLTWEKIAQELRVSVMTVHRWKSGERFPQEHYWSALIAFCGPEIEPYLTEGGRMRHEAYTAKRQREREEYQAVRYRYDFKDDFVQWFPEQSWEITSEEIEAWLKDFKEREKTRAVSARGITNGFYAYPVARIRQAAPLVAFLDRCRIHGYSIPCQEIFVKFTALVERLI